MSNVVSALANKVGLLSAKSSESTGEPFPRALLSREVSQRQIFIVSFPGIRDIRFPSVPHSNLVNVILRNGWVSQRNFDNNLNPQVPFQLCHPLRTKTIVPV